MCTLPKFNMEPENGTLQKEKHRETTDFWVPTVKLEGFKFLNWVAPPSPYFVSKRFPYISLQNHRYKSRLGGFMCYIKLFLLSFQENNLGRELS